MILSPLNSLPPPSKEQQGWPWIPNIPEVDQMLEEIDWPLISVVTPSYNQADFLEETIRSVLLQDYPKLEYIIVDGGSQDGSKEIIGKYEPWLRYWVSEKDAGQSHAINKGFGHAKGEILAWLNSDDYYQPGALKTAVRCLLLNNASIVYGLCNLVDDRGDFLQTIIPQNLTFKGLLHYWKPYAIPPQPAIFFRRHLYLEFGPLDETLHYAMDYDFWLRIALKHKSVYVDKVLANYRIHDQSKSGMGWDFFIPEWDHVARRHCQSRGLLVRSKWLAAYLNYKVRQKLKSMFKKFLQMQGITWL